MFKKRLNGNSTCISMFNTLFQYEYANENETIVSYVSSMVLKLEKVLNHVLWKGESWTYSYETI
jgi:hypothetical protein